MEGVIEGRKYVCVFVLAIRARVRIGQPVEGAELDSLSVEGGSIVRRFPRSSRE